MSCGVIYSSGDVTPCDVESGVFSTASRSTPTLPLNPGLNARQYGGSRCHSSATGSPPGLRLHVNARAAFLMPYYYRGRCTLDVCVHGRAEEDSRNLVGQTVLYPANCKLHQLLCDGSEGDNDVLVNDRWTSRRMSSLLEGANRLVCFETLQHVHQASRMNGSGSR